MSTGQLKTDAYVLSQRILKPLFSLVEGRLKDQPYSLQTAVLPSLALYHLLGSIDASDYSNSKGRHSTAIGLLRQCSESITIIDVGLQCSDLGKILLEKWQSGTYTQGRLRAEIERAVWPSYGPGLFDEAWNHCFAKFVKATQPLTHYSPELAQWQLSILSSSVKQESPFLDLVAKVGVDAFDEVKSARIQIYQSISIWTLGKLLEFNSNSELPTYITDGLHRLKHLIESSQFISNKGNWEDEFAPHLIFFPQKGPQS